MRKNLMIALAVGFILALPSFASASLQGRPTEADPYCEANQPPLGYGRTPIPDGDFAQTGIALHTCEGEHWDGQDQNVGFANNKNDPTAPCTGQDIDATVPKYNLAVFQCADPDTLAGGDPLHPVGVRFAGSGDNAYLDKGRFYVMACIYLVACTGAFAEGCQVVTGGTNTGLPGTDGRDKCKGRSLGDGTVSWYGKDNTPANLLATAISAARLTQGYADDGDCTQDQYAQSSVNDPTCGRDNTAITVSLIG